MTFSKLTNYVLITVALAFIGSTLYFRADAAKAHQNATSAAAIADQYKDLAEAREASLTAIRGLWLTERTVLHGRAIAAESQAKQFKEQNDALSRALADNSDWAAGVIPSGVRSAFQRPSDRPQD